VAVGDTLDPNDDIVAFASVLLSSLMICYATGQFASRFCRKGESDEQEEVCFEQEFEETYYGEEEKYD
jgi:hypothetical protein